ncbi:MAG: two-component system, OmpR family, response regulator MtrA, partial [Anaerolineales bacterium]|nr:two-component system, OmpR family, response regulator MtrA [Anaerolineales bacterium]
MAIHTLLIDDDPDLAAVMQSLLRGQDFDLHSVLTGHEGIEACRNDQPDVVILDLLMPGMDGWEVCQKIREFSNVPILILSALGAPGSVARALDAGADDYLIKPVHAS